MKKQTNDKKLLKRVALASKIVLKEDEKLFKELAKENKPFCLEDKERVRFIEGIGLNLHYFKVSDIKQAIKLLKEDLYGIQYQEMVFKIIDKIFGKGLCSA
jgi:hypothetical protein